MYSHLKLFAYFSYSISDMIQGLFQSPNKYPKMQWWSWKNILFIYSLQNLSLLTHSYIIALSPGLKSIFSGLFVTEGLVCIETNVLKWIRYNYEKGFNYNYDNNYPPIKVFTKSPFQTLYNFFITARIRHTKSSSK